MDLEQGPFDVLSQHLLKINFGKRCNFSFVTSPVINSIQFVPKWQTLGLLKWTLLRSIGGSLFEWYLFQLKLMLNIPR